MNPVRDAGTPRTKRAAALPRSRTILLGALAMIGLLGGVVVLAWACIGLWNTTLGPDSAVLALGLLAATVVCSRIPLRMGLGDTVIMLDSVPLLLAVVMLPAEVSIVLGAVSLLVALIGQPSYPGWKGPFWRVHALAATALAMGLTEYASVRLDGELPVELVQAFILALILETMFTVNVVVELCIEEPESVAGMLRSPTTAANIMLPAFGVAVLTPYADVIAAFLGLLSAVLLMFYGALWVANSQQMEKRRGERLKDTFSRYVPEGVVDDNLESMQEIELGGEQREVSVLFCDIRGFTTWSEDKGATEVITELNVLLTELSASVMEHGGTLDKFTGDGLMAFWGAPVPVEDHAERACRAALDMLQRLEMVNARRTEAGQAPFAIGVAVHSGTAVVGNVGHERRLDYTAIGDTVNTTARLESSTKELGAVLLVSRPTVDRLSENLRSRAMLVGDVVMKGKARPVEAWALQPLRPELEGVDDEFAA
jgi:class 3 adenylate cyclase